MWGRVPLTRVWWKGTIRIRKQFNDAGISTQIFVAGDEPEHSELCRQHEGAWAECENTYLGAKWNQVAKAALKWGADYIFILGSDDFFGPGLIDRYITAIRKNSVHAGLQGIYMYEPRTDRALRLVADTKGNYPTAPGAVTVRRIHRNKPVIGAGRLLHRSIFAGHDYYWEPEKNRALDASMTKTLRLPPARLFVPSPEQLAVDIKTETNIWSFDTLLDVFKDTGCVLPDSSELHSLPEWQEIRALQ